MAWLPPPGYIEDKARREVAAEYAARDHARKMRREALAGPALAGIMAAKGHFDDWMIEWAYETADAMMAYNDKADV